MSITPIESQRAFWPTTANIDDVAVSLETSEEFRQPVVDRFVLTIINRKQMQPDDFENDPTLGVTLKQPFLKRFLRLWEERLAAPPKGTTRYRDAMHFQIKELEEAISQGRPYIPFVDL